MEQPCYKCGQVVEEGRPFCPHCGAPQIRVLMPEPVAVAAQFPEASAGHASPDLPASQTVPVIALPGAWSEAIKPCALAALVACGLMSLGLNAFVAMVSVGFLAVIFYRQRRPGVPINALAGARLGALSGLLWFAISSVLGALVVLFLNKGPEIQKALIQVVDQAASRSSDPQAVAVLERFKTPEGLQFLMVFGIISGLIAAIVLAALGGALGGTILGRRNRS